MQAQTQTRAQQVDVVVCAWHGRGRDQAQAARHAQMDHQGAMREPDQDVLGTAIYRQHPPAAQHRGSCGRRFGVPRRAAWSRLRAVRACSVRAEVTGREVEEIEIQFVDYPDVVFDQDVATFLGRVAIAELQAQLVELQNCVWSVEAVAGQVR
jgi:hypothetical protein